MPKQTHQQIFEKAIQQAIDGGWMADVDSYSFVGNQVNFNLSEITTLELSYPDIIFNHGFAKALWGEEIGKYITRVIKPNGNQLSGEEVPYWKIHLQQMVIAEAPIKYLEQNLPV